MKGEIIIGDSSSDEEDNKQAVKEKVAPAKEIWIGDSSSDEDITNKYIPVKKPPPLKPVRKKEVTKTKPKPRQTSKTKIQEKPKVVSKSHQKSQVISGCIGDSSEEETAKPINQKYFIVNNLIE